MSKRFTDTNKWDHAWFRKLDPKFKCVWIYLIDKCDHAGIWIADFEAMSFHIGKNITKEDVEEIFYEKIKKIGADRYLIQSFIDFQYGELNENNRVHKSVMNRIDKFSNCIEEIKPLISPFKGDKDKDKDKDMDKEKDKEKELEIKCEQISFDLEFIYAEYPRKEGKKAGVEKLKKIIKSQEKYNQVLLAVRNYKKSTYGTEIKFIKQFSSFVSVWEDYLVIENKSQTMESIKNVKDQINNNNPFLNGVINA